MSTAETSYLPPEAITEILTWADNPSVALARKAWKELIPRARRQALEQRSPRSLCLAGSPYALHPANINTAFDGSLLRDWYYY